MRHVIAIFILLIAAWVLLPNAAQAHGVPEHAASMTVDMTDCQGCPQQDGSGHHKIAQNCHHGASCAMTALALMPAASPCIHGQQRQQTQRPGAFARLRSVAVLADIPPPRA